MKPVEKTILALFLGVLVCTSCTKELDLPYPQAEDQIVLNAILHPDSVIVLSINKTLPTRSSGNDFPLITNAEVQLYENNELLGKLSYQDSTYVLNYYPKAGSEYTIEVIIPGHDIISASDKIPLPITADACYLFADNSSSSYLTTRLNILDNTLEDNVYWLTLMITTYGDFECRIAPEKDPSYFCVGIDSSLYTERMFYLHSYSTIPDKFNASIDNTSGGVTEYSGFIRIDDYSLNEENINIELGSIGDPMFQQSEMNQLDSNQYVTLHVMSTSENYDRYLKSSVMYALNNGFRDTPGIFAEPTQIYSNIENGSGIFAAYNSVSIAVEDFPCE
ncbi:DUF4249 domain-containing protein [Catalinimonas sp. 4WD22]|uniref:DUF4249 domain-containing protein n=1 Tax=Catalinimonas locisalis TaxID=3133978 RepID=UPI003101B150